MTTEYKMVPMEWGGHVYEIILRKRSYPKINNCDTDYSIMIRRDGKMIPTNQQTLEQNVFAICRYLWNTSQPVQHTWEDEEKDEPEPRWQSILSENN